MLSYVSTRYLLWFCTQTVVFAHAPFVSCVNHNNLYRSMALCECISLSGAVVEIKYSNSLIVLAIEPGSYRRSLPAINITIRYSQCHLCLMFLYH